MTLSTKVVESRKTIRCLVIQLGRLSDTLQSLMALRAAKQLYPQLEVHLLVREQFSSASQRISWAEKVFLLPPEAFVGPVLRGEAKESHALNDLVRWLAPIVQDPWDMIVNWTFSETSSFLTSLIPAKVKLGYTRRKDGSFYGADGWSHYVQAIIQGGIPQNVHLTDILTTQLLTALQIHVGDPLTEGNAPVTSKSFFSLLLQDQELEKLSAPQSGPKKWVSIQIGSSSSEKSWDVGNWVKLVRMILERHPEHTVLLLGSPAEKSRAEIILKEFSEEMTSSRRLISLVGETNFDLWTAVISHSHWLIAGGSAAVHLASVLGTRVLNLSLGNADFLETGPYGNGHYVLSLNPNSQLPPTPEAVYTVWSYGANEWVHRRQISLEEHAIKLGYDQDVSSIRILRSRIRNTNDGGGVVYDSINKEFLQLQDWTAMVMGHIARYWYCGWVPPVGSELSRETINPGLIKKLRELQECSAALLKICDEASKTATALQIRAASLKSEKIMSIRDREEIHRLGTTLADLELLLENLGRNHFPLSAFAQMSKVLLHNLKGSQLSELGRDTASSYRQIGEGAKIFRDWVQFTLTLAKPVAIVPSNQDSMREADLLGSRYNKPNDKEIFT